MRRFLLAAALLASGLAPAAAQSLHIGLSADPDLLDPTLGSSYYGRIVYAAMCDKLFDLDEKLNIVPQLATGFHYEDPTHLIITLRPGVTFQNGEKFDAEAAKYSLMRHLTMKGSMRAGEVNTIGSVEVVDPLTIRVVLKSPSSPLIAILSDRAGIMLPPQYTEAAGDKFSAHPVCAGPFAFDSRVVQDKIVLKRYPGYWNAGAIHFDEVTYQPFPNPSVRLANLQAGAIDMVDVIAPPDIAAVQKDPKLKIDVYDGITYTGITINTDAGPAAKTAIGQSKLVRQAFELAIDRTALNQVVNNGLYTPVAQANSPSSPYFFTDIQPPPRDVDRAKALLKQAGVSLPVHVEMNVSNNPDAVQTVEVIQSMVQEAGFDLKVNAMEFSSGLSAGYAGNFNTYLIGWSGRSDPDGNMWQMLHTGGAFNYGKYSTPTMDGYLDDARKVSDVAARRALYHKVWDEERETLPLIYLWIQKNTVGMKKSIDGFVPVPDGLLRLAGVTMK